MPRQRRFGVWSILVVILTSASGAQSVDEVGVGMFSEMAPGAPPAGLEPLRFPSIDEDTA